MMSQQFEYIAW